MITWLVQTRMKKIKSDDPTTLRYAVGRLLGWAGIGFNFFLFLSKYTIGVLVGSVAIKGDAINNLTDFMSNIVSILSFRWAEKPADKEHPYGHERTETIAALFMGMLIVYLGIEMLRQSVEKILSPSPVHFEWAAVVVLLLSISVKLYMYSYNKKFARIYNSDLLEANAIDSRNDVFGTTLVLVSTLVSPLIGYDLDGWMGVIVSVIIFYSAWDLLKDVINVLLGEAPSMDTINEMVDIIMANPVVIDVHDIAIHSYGPRYTYATAHVEVDAALSLPFIHAEVDRIERQVMRDMRIELVTHVDPVLLHDEQTSNAEMSLKKAIESCSEDWTIQDFRLENDKSSGKQVLFFDLIVPYNEKRSLSQLKDLILKKIDHPENYSFEMRIVHPYS